MPGLRRAGAVPGLDHEPLLRGGAWTPKGRPCAQVAGRCANRIKEGKFSLEGKAYQLATNNGAAIEIGEIGVCRGPNHLHGGNVGFDKLIWKKEAGCFC